MSIAVLHALQQFPKQSNKIIFLLYLGVSRMFNFGCFYAFIAILRSHFFYTYFVIHSCLFSMNTQSTIVYLNILSTILNDVIYWARPIEKMGWGQYHGC